MDSTYLNKLMIDIANAVIPVIAPALVMLAGIFAAYFVQQVRLLQEKIKAEQPDEYAMIEYWAGKAVVVAEQLKIGGYIDDRKKYALDYLQNKLDMLGIKWDLAMLSDEIEEAVYRELPKMSEFADTQ
jgi:hypothetical protein